MTAKSNFADFTADEVIDILVAVDRSTAKDALAKLKALGYNSDAFYSTQGCHTVAEFAKELTDTGRGSLLAETFKITFEGGPHGSSWYNLDLQCFLEDRISMAITQHGSQIVARSLGLT